MVQDDYSDEFPLLRAHGLYASPISGDGDCLFHALSDQLYGHENSHRELRARIVTHMRQHSSYFKLFLSVPPARKKAKGKSEFVPLSESAIDVAFEQHVKRMSQQGVYGDNIEICAFAREFGVHVKIYQREFAYVVTGNGDEDGDGGESKMVHIAYHTWEHYSSIRNIAGPHTGLPGVMPVLSLEAATAKVGVEGKKKGGGKYALPWMVSMVMKSLPYLATEEEVAKALEECKGDVNEAVGRMLDKDMGVVDGDGDGDGNGDSPKSHPQKKGKASITSPTNNTTPSKHTTSQAASKGKAKRETARERKERQKAEAAERKRNKGAGGFRSDSKTGTTLGPINGIEGGIRELYI
ncbi:hypothetical protein EV426DRAFT_569000 [Tirmania nivea]|nr:hypothetical protein EV426DRAFT_569000 [Tirmania nivea]